MSAFEVSVTPTRIKNARKKSAAREPTAVVMAPFSAKSIASFEDIPVNKNALRILNVINPTDQILNVTLTKLLDPNFGVVYETADFEIPPQGTIPMELSWSPVEEMTIKGTLQFTDQRRFKKDVIVILKSIDKRGPLNNCPRPAVSIANAPARSGARSSTLQLVPKKPKSPNQKTHKQRVQNGAVPKVITTSRFNADTNRSAPLREMNLNQHLMEFVSQPTTSRLATVSMHRPPTLHYGDKENTPTNITTMLNDEVFTTPTGGGNSATSSAIDKSKTPDFSDLLDQIKFTPDARAGRETNQFSTRVTPSQRPARDVSLWALATPQDVAGVAGIRGNRIEHSQSNGTEQNFNPNICSTVTRSNNSIAEDENILRRKLFDENQLRQQQLQLEPDKTFELPVDHQFEFHLSPGRSANPNRTSSPVADGSIALFTANVSPRIAANPSPARIGLSMIREESFVDRYNSQTDGRVTQQITFDVAPPVMDTSVASSTIHSDSSHAGATSAPEAGTPLRKRYQSMRDLNQQHRIDQAAMLRNPQGSMPNLNDIQHVKPIESNRYFYQNHELVQSARELQQPIASAASTDHHHHHQRSSICSNMSYSISNHTHSVHDIHFQENEILAESSRFNINRCHETNNGGGVDGATYRLADSTRSSSVQSMPGHVSDAQRATFAVPHPATTLRRGSASSMRLPVIQTTAPTPPRNAPLQKRALSTDTGSQPSLRRSYKHSPPKRTRLLHDDDDDEERSFHSTGSLLSTTSPRSKSTSSLSRGETNRVSTWSSSNRFSSSSRRLAGRPSISGTMLKKKRDERVLLYDADMHIQGVINPDPFAATTTCDPFLAATMYLDDKCVERHEQDFIKWLNALLTIPSDLTDSSTSARGAIDVGALFNSVRTQDVVLAQTKESASNNYFTRYRLDGLRRAAIRLYVSAEMRTLCERLVVHIERKQLRLRDDRDLHRNISNQREMLELLLCINPLWLRLGLEVVFGEQIFMQHKADMMSLSYFIVNRLFRDKDAEQRHSKAYARSDEYTEHVKKFTLKKVLMLLLFLDKAKQHRIIVHNPCLFDRASPYKETKDVLLKFSSAMIGNVGDVQKDLRRIGYVLSHKQTYLDEFEYAVRNVAVDLRDGVRLTKVMEIILLRDDLTQKLRVPAISRMQRIFNVELALRALHDAEFHIKGQIGGADIADGHREKTLSLLWQLIHKFRSPMFVKAAKTIQAWWRHSWLRVTIDRRIRCKLVARRERAAIRLQAAFRAHQCRRFCRMYRAERTEAAIVVQKYARRMIAMRNFHYRMSCLVHIQRTVRATLQMRSVRARFRRTKEAAIRLQRWWRRVQLRRKLQLAAVAIRGIREEVRLRTEKATIIQIYYRAHLQRKQQLTEYTRLKTASVHIQRWFRAHRIGRAQRDHYVRLRLATIRIQQRLRARMQRNAIRLQFETLRSVTVRVQQRFRAARSMRCERTAYLALRSHVLVVQRRFRATLLMRQQRSEYQRLRQATVCVQRLFRANALRKEYAENYARIKTAAITIQRYRRSCVEMRAQRQRFIQMRTSCIRIQRAVRSYRQMESVRRDYQQLREHVLIVQSRVRANRAMRVQRARYLGQREAVVRCQQRFRANCAMRAQRHQFQALRRAVCCVQARFRAHRKMLCDRRAFERLKWAAITVQRRIRAQRAMRHDRRAFVSTRSACVAVQSRFRALREMRHQHQQYQHLRTKVIYIERLFRANRMQSAQQHQFQRAKSAAICIQRRYRELCAMRTQRAQYLRLHQSIVRIQRGFRARQQMLVARGQYQLLRTNVIRVQRRFRAVRLMRVQVQLFQCTRNSAIQMQRRVRANTAMRAQRTQFQRMKSAAVVVQQRWRALRQMRTERAGFLRLRQKTLVIQRRFRSYVETMNTQNAYLELKFAAMQVQQRYRARQAMRVQRDEYRVLRISVLTVQRRFRARTQMRRDTANFERLKSATICIQQRWRGYVQMRAQRTEYHRQVRAIRWAQSRVRAISRMRVERTAFERVRQAAICVQRRYRALVQMRTLRVQFQLIRCLVVCVQRRFRAHLQMRECRAQFLALRRSVVFCQTAFRSRRLMRAEQARYVCTRRTVFGLQTHIRGYLARLNYQRMLTPEVLLRRRQIQAARLVQRVWRGFTVRRRETRKMQAIRENIRQATRNVEPEMIMRNRIANAVRMLRGRFNALEALRILKELVKISREVPQVLVNDAAFIANFCYGIMSQAIRSEVDKQIIELCSYVILNLSRYAGTKENTFQIQGLETIAQMLLRWCDKECAIFNTLCSVIYVQVQCDAKKTTIRQFMTSNEAIFMLAETKKLVIRKENMRRNRAPHPKFPALTQRQRRQLPMLEPDYGLRTNQSAYGFLCSVFAFDTILGQMDIQVLANM